MKRGSGALDDWDSLKIELRRCRPRTRVDQAPYEFDSWYWEWGRRRWEWWAWRDGVWWAWTRAGGWERQVWEEGRWWWNWTEWRWRWQPGRFVSMDPPEEAQEQRTTDVVAAEAAEGDAAGTAQAAEVDAAETAEVEVEEMPEVEVESVLEVSSEERPDMKSEDSGGLSDL